MDELLEVIKQAFTSLKNFVRKIINGIISFMGHVVNWFRGLHLNQERHSPFICNAQKEEIKKMLKSAPVRDVGIFKGVYDEQTGEIIHSELLDGDALDTQTKNILGDEAIVVLT
ncbi:hypothetical protein HDR58_10175 [bacterium]|nr:hypothetical protein [bacterium]